MSVAVALVAWWVVGLRRERARSLLPGIAVQLIALATLVIILLPVISLTDDLQACNTPAEVEHLARRGDLQPLPDQPLQNLPVALALLSSWAPMPGSHVLGFRASMDMPVRQARGHIQVLAIRPPPAA